MTSAGTISLILTVLVSLAFVMGQDTPGTLVQTEDFEKRSKSLEKELVCPICPGESLHQSQSDLAKSMRSVMREKLELGQTEDQIKDYFVGIYGESVLASPKADGIGLAAWIIPPILMTAGLGALIRTIRSYRRKHQESSIVSVEPYESPDESLTEYLNLVDEELKK